MNDALRSWITGQHDCSWDESALRRRERPKNSLRIKTFCQYPYCEYAGSVQGSTSINHLLLDAVIHKRRHKADSTTIALTSQGRNLLQGESALLTRQPLPFSLNDDRLPHTCCPPAILNNKIGSGTTIVRRLLHMGRVACHEMVE
eukprot:m.1278619 g.1278619  ORF g.1278619 m.1278619 type:complete len:145 (+) comp24765_c0_seq4:94-528(+)